MSALERINSQVLAWLLEVGSNEALQMSKGLTRGKMLRSKLILAIAGEGEKNERLCAIIEMIQSASLLHDDVIDDATTRRGNPSINTTFGDKNAIMLGDIFYSKAFFELANLDLDVARVVSNAVVRLSSGELSDVKMSEAFNSDSERYMKMIDDKTASLIEASAEAAAILAGMEREAFRIYGKNLGLAFQIIDDLLDITQDSSKLGKPALSDFREGKTTLPYIYLWEKLNSYDRERLQSYFGREIDASDSAWIYSKMVETGALKRAFSLARSLGEEAISRIKEYGCENLEKIMLEMIEREF